MIEAFVLVLFPILVAFAGASDLFTMTIPNRVSVLMICAFVIMAFVTKISFGAISSHFLGGAIVFVACFAMFSFGWMGGGDAKIASAIGLWFGFSPDLLNFVVLTGLYGAFLTIGLLALRQVPALPVSFYRQDWLTRLLDNKTGIPYGIAIAAAALHVYPTSKWMAFAL